MKTVFRALLLALLALPLLYSGDDQPSQLERVEQRGSLILLTRNSASSYYLGADGPTGPEYELVRQFSRFLDVDLEVEVVSVFSELATMFQDGQGDLIAANLTRTEARESQFQFGPDYLQTRILAVQSRRSTPARSIAELVGLKIMIVAGSSYEEALQKAKVDYPDLRWESRIDVSIEDLLLAVADRAIDVTLIDSNIYSVNEAYYPGIQTAFVVTESVPHAWAFRPGQDRSLVEKAEVFLAQAEQDGRIAAIMDRFYQPAEELDQMGMLLFLKRTRALLPQYIEEFQLAGERYGIDWRLLAAIGYQESHWDSDASSYTGVRGIMMLTAQTAKQLGVDDRLDPKQSIDGGARYLSRLIKRLPGRIPEPDRTFMVLAAYNMGMGHLRDARRLTQKQGRNPDIWADVSISVDLLSQEKWHSQTRFGYARGFEAVSFVENIRRFYDVLVWMDTREHPLLVKEEES